MKILIGCDVDPILPPILSRLPDGDVWSCLGELDRLIEAAAAGLPPITWLIRADESVRFSTGNFASGYLVRQRFWQSLVARGHELGWHMHLWSFNAHTECFQFDPDPSWLTSAWQALSAHYDVASTRTGWDYGDNRLFRNLESLGISVDFSALPGTLAWHTTGGRTISIDWARCPTTPYHPHPADYQRPGDMNLLEIPITPFRNSISGIGRRLARRLSKGVFSIAGLRNTTKTMTDRWDSPQIADSPVWACYFHPEDLRGNGLRRFLHNLDWLRRNADVEFVTASAARRYLISNAPRLGEASSVSSKCASY